MSGKTKVIEDVLSPETLGLLSSELDLQWLHEDAIELKISEETKEDMESDVDYVRIFR